MFGIDLGCKLTNPPIYWLIFLATTYSPEVQGPNIRRLIILLTLLFNLLVPPRCFCRRLGLEFSFHDLGKQAVLLFNHNAQAHPGVGVLLPPNLRHPRGSGRENCLNKYGSFAGKVRLARAAFPVGAIGSSGTGS